MYNKKGELNTLLIFCYIGLFNITLFDKGFLCGLDEAITVLLGCFFTTCLTDVTCLLDAPPLQEHAIKFMFYQYINSLLITFLFL